MNRVDPVVAVDLASSSEISMSPYVDLKSRIVIER